MLIREGRRCRDKRGNVKRNNSSALGQGPGSPSRDTHNDTFELFCRYWNSHQVEKVLYGAHKHVDPRPVGTRRLVMLASTHLTTNPSEECPRADHALFEPLLENSSLPLQVGTHSFEGISQLWTPLPGKAIKLFFFTSPKTLSPRFNLVSGYKNWIWFHYHLQDRRATTSVTDQHLNTWCCIQGRWRRRTRPILSTSAGIMPSLWHGKRITASE